MRNWERVLYSIGVLDFCMNTCQVKYVDIALSQGRIGLLRPTA